MKLPKTDCCARQQIQMIKKNILKCRNYIYFIMLAVTKVYTKVSKQSTSVRACVYVAVLSGASGHASMQMFVCSFGSLWLWKGKVCPSGTSLKYRQWWKSNKQQSWVLNTAQSKCWTKQSQLKHILLYLSLDSCFYTLQRLQFYSPCLCIINFLNFTCYSLVKDPSALSDLLLSRVTQYTQGAVQSHPREQAVRECTRVLYERVKRKG